MIPELLKKCPGFVEKSIRKVYGSIPYERMLGSTFRYMYEFLQVSQWWMRKQQEEYQMFELAKLLRHAYENVPYYKNVFDERGLKPADIQSFHDLKQLPFLTRDIIIKNREKLIARNYSKWEYRMVTTGGTSGIPMEFTERRRYSAAREWAFIASLLKAVNYNAYERNRSVLLKGYKPIGNYYEYRGLQLVLSPNLMAENNMDSYLKKISRFNADFIQAYPSAAGLLAGYIIRNNIKFESARLKAVICGSETISKDQRKKIEKAFGVRVYSHYGHSEKACLAGECEYSDNYHIVPEYGYTEIISDDNIDVSGEDETGEIVCTGFNNYVMPFIRYRTGDLALNTNSNCICGRSHKLLKSILGRAQDFFISENGEKLSFIFADYPLWHIKDRISAYQYIQSEPGNVLLYIEHAGVIASGDMKTLLSEFKKWYPSLNLSIRIVNKIERTRSGKFRYLVQRLPVNSFSALYNKER